MAFNKKIAFLGKMNIEIDNVTYLIFKDINMALMDYDILIFNPNLFYKLTDKNYSYEEYKDGNSKWLKKILEFLFSKNNIFIFATKPIQLASETIYKPIQTYKIYTADITNTILQFTNKKDESGKVILKKTSSILDNFYNRFKESLKYHITYENVTVIDTLLRYILPTVDKINSQSIDIFTGKDTKKILSSIIKIDNGGNILLLPEVLLKEEKDLTDLLNIIVEIDKNLNKEMIKTPKPQWLESNENYFINISESIKSKLSNINEEINKLNEKKEELNRNLEKEEQIKDLLFENGKPLENAIIEALRILDYEADNVYIDNNEIDILAKSPEGDIFCCEAEGRDNKAIDITKFRQLLDHIAIYKEYIKYKSDVNGILFGNVYRKEKLENRPVEYFTEHCLQGAISNNFILIKTTDLFFVIRDIKNCNDNKKVEEYKKKCRGAILNSKGKVVDFPRIDDK